MARLAVHDKAVQKPIAVGDISRSQHGLYDGMNFIIMGPGQFGNRTRLTRKAGAKLITSQRGNQLPGPGIQITVHQGTVDSALGERLGTIEHPFMTGVRSSGGMNDKYTNDNPPGKIDEQRSAATHVISLMSPAAHSGATVERWNGWNGRVMASPDYRQIGEVACNSGLRIADPATQRYTQHHRAEPGGLVKSR
jgi:hypothetical protein